MKVKTIGERLLALRTEYGLSAEKLANLVGVTRVTIDNIESGTTAKPYPKNIEAICKALGSTSEWLVNGKGEMLPNGKVDLTERDRPVANIYQDTLYKELRDQIEFLRDMLRTRSFHKAINLPSLQKKRRSLVAKTA